MTQLTRSARMAGSPRSSPSVLLSRRYRRSRSCPNRLTVGSGDKVSVTKWIEYYYAGISQDAVAHLRDSRSIVDTKALRSRSPRPWA